MSIVKLKMTPCPVSSNLIWFNATFCLIDRFIFLHSEYFPSFFSVSIESYNMNKSSSKRQWHLIPFRREFLFTNVSKTSNFGTIVCKVQLYCKILPSHEIFCCFRYYVTISCDSTSSSLQKWHEWQIFSKKLHGFLVVNREKTLIVIQFNDSYI